MDLYNNTMNPVGGRRDYAWRGKIGKMDVRRSLSHATDKHSSVDLLKLQDKYNLKGFEFGNYTSNDDRHDFAIATKTSLEDLMFVVLGTRNIGVDRLVGIAFGARGMGGRAAAHYEPGFNMINLTKPHGAGTLAHEYGHALDFNLGRYIDQNKLYSALSGGSSVARTLESNTGGQLRYWTNKIVDAVKATDSFKRLDKAGDYWRERTEVFARTFEQYVCYALKTEGLTNQFLTKSWIQYTTRAAYLREDDFMKILPDMQQLVREISLFLNDKGKLVPRAYPTTAKKVVMPKPEKKAEPKVAAAKQPVVKTSSKEKVKCKLKHNDLCRFCIKDKYAPQEVLKGVYYSAGTAVSTNGFIMAVFNVDYPKEYEGKIINKAGENIKGKYVNWKSVVPRKHTIQRTCAASDFSDAITKKQDVEIFNGIWVDSVLLKEVIAVAKKLTKGTPSLRIRATDGTHPVLFDFGSYGFIVLSPLVQQ
jgi:hypothetical protein